jgi:exonuclease SbcC
VRYWESERLLSEEHVRLNARKNALDELHHAVDAAVAAEKRFDIDKLVVVRSQLSQTENILTRQQLLLNQLQNHEQQKLSIQEKLEQLQLEQKRDISKLKEIVETLQPAAQQAFRAARQQLQFIEAAVDAQVELLRNNLQSGQECPVCGSTEHPWRHHQPKLELTAVTAARTSVADLERQCQDISDQGIRLKAAIENRDVHFRERETELLRNQQDSERLTLEFPDHPEAVAIIRLPERVRMKSLSDRLKQVSAELQDVEMTEREHRAAQKAVESTQQQLTDSRQQLTLVEEQIRKQELQFQGIRDQNRVAEQTHAHALQTQERAAGQLEELLKLLPDLKETCVLDPADFRRRLTEGTQNYTRTEKRLSELLAAVQELEAGLAPLREASAQADRYAAESRNLRQTAADEYQLIRNERSGLLGGQSAAVKETEMQESLQKAQQSHQEATQRDQAAEKQLAAAVADLSSGTKAKDAADQALTAAVLALDSWCVRFSVNTGRTLNSEELRRFLMRDDAWMKAERASLDTVTSELRNAEGAFQVHEQQLSQHLTLQPENTDEAAVEAAITVLQQEVATAIQKADEMRAYIVSDDERRRNNLEAARQLEQLEQQADPWLRLNDLLGSADGAKFRMIAQRRTLDVLLVYANQQLEMLATRYRLERLPESLNLVVIDRDMGDEHRSVHSLSGGESFLVSLALALGLASLTSSRLRIESLFIDEGFGSLDPETLNTAMNALLHLEAQGRKVGVISHVTEMTDAIPVQIRIVKGRGGASRIIVPGMVADLPSEPPDNAADRLADRAQTNAPRRPQKSTRKMPSDGRPVHPAVTPPPFNQSAVDATAGGILSILIRELSLGRTKVSSRMLRDELGCPPDVFKAAQAQLGDRICTEGRSLKLQLPSDS